MLKEERMQRLPGPGCKARVAKVDRVERVAGVARFTSKVRVPRVLRWPGRQGLQGWPQW